jgi:general stress protein 26
MDQTEAARRWAEALSRPTEEHKEALAGVLADGVVSATPLGVTEGVSDVLAGFGRSPLAEHLEKATWTEPVEEGDDMVVTVTFAPGAPVGGLSLRFRFDQAGRIARADTALLPAPPPEPKPVKLTEAMRASVNGALLNRTPVMVAYVDPDGQPHLSFRGSTQAFSDDQLAIWVRAPQGGLVSAIEHNPRLALFYRDPETRTAYQFHGRAHVERDAATADTVYANAPEPERNIDLQRRGVAVVVDIDRVEGRDADGPILMSRDASE